MISVSVWFPLRMPRSVDTSKITACVGIFSAIDFRRTCSFLSPARWAKRSAAGSPAIFRFAIESPSILAKLDLPEPKKPDTQIAIPSWGLLGVSRYASKMSV